MAGSPGFTDRGFIVNYPSYNDKTPIGFIVYDPKHYLHIVDDFTIDTKIGYILILSKSTRYMQGDYTVSISTVSSTSAKFIAHMSSSVVINGNITAAPIYDDIFIVSD